jgi:hypothetical protein
MMVAGMISSFTCKTGRAGVGNPSCVNPVGGPKATRLRLAKSGLAEFFVFGLLAVKTDACHTVE